MITGKIISLRDATKSDVSLIMGWENNPENWDVSETKEPYSEKEIEALIDSAKDYNESYQKRWVIIDKDTLVPLGAVDVFRGDLPSSETGIGILVAEEFERRKGFATEAIQLAISKCTTDFKIEKFYANIHSTNTPSLNLFKKCNFSFEDGLSENSNFDLDSPTIIKMSLCQKK